MIEIIKQAKPYQPKHGDILYGADFLICTLNDGPGMEIKTTLPQAFPLSRVNHLSWSALNILGINADSLRKWVNYKCPYMKQTYNWMVPFAVRSLDIKKYAPALEEHGFGEPAQQFSRTNLILDWQYHADTVEDWRTVMTRFHSLMMGSGYTEGTRTTDGFGEQKQGFVELDNGDFLEVWFWEWYNN